jgi:hypothetical protein
MRSHRVPRYYFHLRNDVNARDEEGTELPNLAAALQKAVAEACYMTAASVLEHGRINLHHAIEVADETGQVLERVEFGDVVKVER